MALRYVLDPNLVLVPESEDPPSDLPLVEVLSDKEFEALGKKVNAQIRRNLAALIEAESCYVDVYPDCIIGSMAVPDKEDLMGDRKLFSFYWQKERLIFIDESQVASKTLKRMADVKLADSMTTATCLYSFMRELLIGDTAWLGDLEDKMEDAEEAMLASTDVSLTDDLTMYRRITVRLTTYYQQLGGVALVLSSNENRMMTEEEAANFEYIIGSTDRLENRAETIREYSLTLRDLHQTQIDVKQNNTMQLLTIVTVLIAPLSLIAGWFGMNFTNIPGVNEPWGFTLICVVGVAITVALVLWFHKKRWI